MGSPSVLPWCAPGILGVALMQWIEPITHPSIHAGQVHVWRVDLARLRHRAADYRALLAENERLRADRFVSEIHREDYIAARGTLRILLAQYLKTQPSLVPIKVADEGKPYVGEPFDSQKLSFNLSHSQGLCLIAVGLNRALGVDLEKVRGDVSCASSAGRSPSRLSPGGLSLPQSRPDVVGSPYTCDLFGGSRSAGVA